MLDKNKGIEKVERSKIAYLLTHPWLPAVVAATLGLAFAFLLPAYRGPDEYAHVAYVSALAQGRLPVLPTTPVADIGSGTTWQAQHPPFFYLLATPLYIAAGKNPLIGLYVLRVFGVALLLTIVLMVHRLARSLLSPREAHVAALLVASHPVVTYTSAMVNNEALAVALSVACVRAAVEAGRSAVSRRWVLLAVLLGGLALLTKLTAIAGVCAAAFAVVCASGGNLPLRARLWRGFIIAGGAVALWLPWGLYMHSLHGTFVPSPVARPAFTGGFGALLLFPIQALLLVFYSVAEFAIGLLVPYWLMRNPYAVAAYVVLACGWLLVCWVMYRSVAYPALRFIAPGFVTLYVLVLNQIMFRDVAASRFAARYTFGATVLVALLIAADYSRASPRIRSLLTTLWFSLSVFTIGYVFYYFR